ncbi:hypothetical protein QP027_05595 [Corynebacterium breve]|uniref:Prolipoprotein LppL n=1 Tax=Corynebacterium breve TaxID=3049799 RepID=A0ABY8VKY2_9CORY|nr:hypothetical protein [Corynebacterium breve]WIM68854.1 hypothetical protein QP027_05595 [Corynebacterium breve]
MKKVQYVALISAFGLALTACNAEGTAPEPGPEMGNAQPVASPEQPDPTGEVHEFEDIIDLDQTGDTLGVRTADKLTIGTIDEITDGTAKAFPVDDTCTDVSASADKFVIACGKQVRVVDGKNEEAFTLEEPVQSAAITSTGELIAVSGDSAKAWVYKGGEKIDSFAVAHRSDSVFAVQHDDGQPDSVVRYNRENTTIQDIDWENGRQGGTLRVGIGIGQAVAGPDGLVLAADAQGSQLAVYTTGQVIRLQQMAPVAESPWAVAWDSSRDLAWVGSTAENIAVGYDISNGVPQKRYSVNTVPDALHMATLDDGSLVFASASGAGLQIIPTDQIK